MDAAETLQKHQYSHITYAHVRNVCDWVGFVGTHLTEAQHQ